MFVTSFPIIYRLTTQLICPWCSITFLKNKTMSVVVFIKVTISLSSRLILKTVKPQLEIATFPYLIVVLITFCRSFSYNFNKWQSQYTRIHFFSYVLLTKEIVIPRGCFLIHFIIINVRLLNCQVENALPAVLFKI